MASRLEKAAFVLFGPPGSGKGTQAVLLADRLKVPHVSTGDILREHIAAGDGLGQEVQALMRAGKLVPDELVNRIVEERIKRPDCENGLILDGYPRTLHQAQILCGLLKRLGIEQVIVNLVVDYNKIITRITARRQCPVCGAVYNLVFNPPKNNEFCDRDGAALVSREDDREEVLRRRFQEYERQTLPLLEHFRSSGMPYYEVNGNSGAPEEIAGRICGLIDNG